MTPLLEFADVYYRYPGQERYALDGLTVAFPGGENIALIGRNGAGKSTLFLHCNGLYRPDTGEVRFGGRPLAYDRKSLKVLRQHIGVVFQNADEQLFSASVAQDISFGPFNLGLTEQEVRRRVQMAAELCEVVEMLERPTHALSGGEKARVALAGVLAMDPDILISDELMANLDPWGRRRIFDIFKRLHRRGKTIVLATHDLNVVRRWATYVVVMAGGRAAFAGSPDDLLANQAVLDETGLAEVWFDEF
ncbi:MAG TPA: ABC transporter ATP-binding protein [Anaerolineae bacterium]|nr:ABC transporter ATP-binding protein [Anaerolineae bacterium]HRV93860.1 ABC transporter ATP-binding protein [Anaerolineae bacterium]